MFLFDFTVVYHWDTVLNITHLFLPQDIALLMYHWSKSYHIVKYVLKTYKNAQHFILMQSCNEWCQWHVIVIRKRSFCSNHRSTLLAIFWQRFNTDLWIISHLKRGFLDELSQDWSDPPMIKIIQSQHSWSHCWWHL